MQKLLIICGPTAVGKTSFSIECAKKFNGELISADSIQIYKELNIGSAKATQEERKQAVHHLIDFVEPDKEFSVCEFSQLAKQKIEEIAQRGKLPIIVGGTGLFIKSLLYPMSFGNANKDDAIREYWQKFLEENGNQHLMDELIKVDPETAQTLTLNDTRRMIRALEIYQLTGQKKSNQNDTQKQSPYDYKLLFLDKDRTILYEDINKRVDIMFDLGLEDEVKNLVKKWNLTSKNQSMQAIGYKEFFDYFDGKKTIDDVKESIKIATRHYAKRQFTFFRHMENVEFIKSNENQNNIKNIEKWLKS